MKKVLTLIAWLISMAELRAQNLEVAVQAGGNLSHYSGTNAEAYNSLGTKSRVGYQAGLQLQQNFKSGWLIGLYAGYEALKNSSHYSPIYFDNPLYYATVPTASGTSPVDYMIPDHVQTIFTNKFLNINPYLGYRFIMKDISIDVMPGLELGIRLSSTGKTEYSYSGSTGTADDPYNSAVQGSDLRLRGGLAVHIQRWSITGGYAYGLIKYLKTADEGSHSHIARLGLAYRLF
ncbi:PorT family protein [Mucilaginibacter robiniae]|uniref:PorT family protein n=1 Tax=Mucilaginibacter robiniae TaxID=2728022 RepID=A0A7L5DUI6_9SPHI|nr:outer membrane beta-barrel protein [Mucilaginibacter robiniae]QJD94785.1 PorT family protein [Mucilaginibacter robiniae]